MGIFVKVRTPIMKQFALFVVRIVCLQTGVHTVHIFVELKEKIILPGRVGLVYKEDNLQILTAHQNQIKGAKSWT